MASRPGDLQVDAFLEHYRLLELDPNAGAVDEAAIKKAYRKKALELHPDKNRDKPNAEAQFDAVKKASEALLNNALRSEFESKLAARAATAARFKEQDDARRALREALEARERAAGRTPVPAGAKHGQSGAAAAAVAAPAARTDAQAELARLREEGRERIRSLEVSRALDRRAAAAAATAIAAAGTATAPSDTGSPHPPLAYESVPSAGTALPRPPPPAWDIGSAVRVKWGDEDNAAHGEAAVDTGEGGARGAEGWPGASGAHAPGARIISESQLLRWFGRFGPVAAVISKKDQSACVCFTAAPHAAAAVATPPTPFLRVAPVLQDVGSKGVGAVGASGAGASAGGKRPRPLDSERDGSSTASSAQPQPPAPKRLTVPSSSALFGGAHSTGGSAGGGLPLPVGGSGPGRPAADGPHPAGAGAAPALAPAPVPLASPAAGGAAGLSLEAKEAEVLARMMAAAATRRVQALGALGSGGTRSPAHT